MITIPTPKTEALREKHKYDGNPAFGEAIELCYDLEVKLALTTKDLLFRREIGKLQNDQYDKLYEEVKSLNEEVKSLQEQNLKLAQQLKNK
jgi:hypothetical protein